MANEAIEQALGPVRDIVKASTGRAPSESTIWRWRVNGVNGVKLECFPAGKTWLTTPAAFSEFVRKQAEKRQEAIHV